MSALLKKCSEYEKKEDRVEALRLNCDEATKRLLGLMFHPDVKFNLPDGAPPYNPSQFNEINMLYSEMRRMYLFIQGFPGNNDMPNLKRERLFIDILQAVIPEDAELILAMKEKKSPYKGLTEEVVLAAFPEMFPT